MFAAGMVNLKRDPFEMSWGDEKKAAFWFSGALAGPVTAYIYDWNLLPIGQALWLEGAGDLQGRSRRCRIRRATTWIRSWSSSRSAGPPEPVADQTRNTTTRAPLRGARTRQVKR